MDISGVESAWLSGSAQFDKAVDSADAQFFKPLAESIIAMAVAAMPDEAKQYVDPALLKIAGVEERDARSINVPGMVEEPY